MDRGRAARIATLREIRPEISPSSRAMQLLPRCHHPRYAAPVPPFPALRAALVAQRGARSKSTAHAPSLSRLVGVQVRPTERRSSPHRRRRTMRELGPSMRHVSGCYLSASPRRTKTRRPARGCGCAFHTCGGCGSLTTQTLLNDRCRCRCSSRYRNYLHAQRVFLSGYSVPASA